MNTIGQVVCEGSPQRAGLCRAAAGVAPARRAFTIIEILLALGIFSLLIVGVYSSWSSILRAARVGTEVAADVQRTRIAMQTVEDALVSTVMFTSNPYLYAFETDTSGDFAVLSFVARLPPGFPGSGYFGDQVVRRVAFRVEQPDRGENALVLRQMPILQTNVTEEAETSIILARNVSTFLVEFLEPRGLTMEWVPEWRLTNQLPRMMRVALAFGEIPAGRKASPDLVIRTVSLPAVAVPRDSQAALPRPPGAAPGTVPGQPDLVPDPGVPFTNPDGMRIQSRGTGGGMDRRYDLFPGSGQGILRGGGAGLLPVTPGPRLAGGG